MMTLYRIFRRDNPHQAKISAEMNSFMWIIGIITLQGANFFRMWNEGYPVPALWAEGMTGIIIAFGVPLFLYWLRYYAFHHGILTDRNDGAYSIFDSYFRR